MLHPGITLPLRSRRWFLFLLSAGFNILSVYWVSGDFLYSSLTAVLELLAASATSAVLVTTLFDLLLAGRFSVFRSIAIPSIFGIAASLIDHGKSVASGRVPAVDAIFPQDAYFCIHIHAMTPKQIERLKKKIADIKRILSAEKRKFGCYDDSRGLRYLPTGYFVQLGDYSGGLTYLKWFHKNFEDDSGFPEFLFESAIIYFGTSRLKEAAKAAFQTFCSNPYWIDRFFGRPLVPLDIWHSSNVTTIEYTEALVYSSAQADLGAFTEWLSDLVSGDDFTRRSTRYIEIYRQLKTETDRESRRSLVEEAYQLEH